jgi:hypothetical protein
MAIRKITVPKTPRSAYNPDRPVSGLLKAQIAMLEQANLSHDPATPVKGSRGPKTEGQAARYIQQLHSALHDHLRTSAAVRNALPPTALRAALAPRSSSTPDGSKKWPATAGPSTTARQRAPVKGGRSASGTRKHAGKRQPR